MGEYADMMINGEACQGCGLPFEEEQGHPSFCGSCWRERKKHLGKRAHSGDRSRSKLIKPPAVEKCSECGRDENDCGCPQCLACKGAGFIGLDCCPQCHATGIPDEVASD